MAGCLESGWRELELELTSTRVVSKWRDELEERVTNSFGWSGKLGQLKHLRPPQRQRLRRKWVGSHTVAQPLGRVAAVTGREEEQLLQLRDALKQLGPALEDFDKRLRALEKGAKVGRPALPALNKLRAQLRIVYLPAGNPRQGAAVTFSRRIPARTSPLPTSQAPPNAGYWRVDAGADPASLGDRQPGCYLEGGRKAPSIEHPAARAITLARLIAESQDENSSVLATKRP